MGDIFDLIFGCRHRRYTFPITPERNKPSSTYVACLSCGRELEYSWQEMRTGKQIKIDPRAGKLVEACV